MSGDGYKAKDTDELVEKLNSQLRNYCLLGRHLGSIYSALLQFFLNHLRLE